MNDIQCVTTSKALPLSLWTPADRILGGLFTRDPEVEVPLAPFLLRKGPER
jgi:hypothetical protein